jgi:hypothetical protein
MWWRKRHDGLSPPSGRPLEVGKSAVVVGNVARGPGSVVLVLELRGDDALADDLFGTTQVVPTAQLVRPDNVGYLDCADSHGYRIDPDGEPYGTLL